MNQGRRMLERRNGCDILSPEAEIWFCPTESCLGIEARDTSVLLIVDVQERLAPAISTIDMVLAKAGLLIGAASRLGIPIAFTEQYASGLGKTLPSLRNLAATAPVISKIHFQATLEPDL